MSTEAERLKNIRKVLKFNQKTFAESLGMTSAGLSLVELGYNPVQKKLKILLNNVHRVNIAYLETGEGEMFEKDSRPNKLRDPKDVLIEAHEGEIKRLQAEREMHLELLKSKDKTIEALEKNTYFLESLLKKSV